MSVNVNDFKVAIRIDNAQAKAKLIETSKEIGRLEDKLVELSQAGKENTEEYKQTQKTIDELNRKYVEFQKEAGRSAMNMKTLKEGAAKLRRELARAIPGTEEEKRLQEALKLTTTRMDELRGSAQQTHFSISKFADGFNRYAALGASFVAGLTGMVLTMRECVDAFAKMEEAQSGVIKYTGMTKAQVAELNEEFKKMDTRASREQLNELAATAGRLGIQSKKDVLEFVEAANMINVSLGEDLGDDAIKNIGKLADMFQDSSRSMKENMLAIGSAVNSVAQNSSASEPYLVEFAARLGGVAKQARLSVTDVMGFASALDQNMLRSEMASTALSGLIMKIYQEPAKYARLAGLDVKDFTEMMERDVNTAILTFLDSLGRLGSMGKMAPVLKEMKLSGAEAASVISTLAGNVAKIEKEQRQANQAYTEGTSIINEYNVQNSTVQAELEKAQKRFKDVRIELGEKLQPAMKYMVTTGSLTVKGLSTLVSLLIEYKGVLGAAAAGVAAYTIAVNAAAVKTKVFTLATKAAAAAVDFFDKMTKKTAWGLAISLIASAASYLFLFKGRADDATKSLKDMNSELDEMNKHLKRYEDVKERAKNLDTLNDRQKAQLKSDAEEEVKVLEDKLAKETMAWRKYYQATKESITKANSINGELTVKGYLLLRGLEKDTEAKAKEMEKILNRKKELEALASSIKIKTGGTIVSNQTPEDAYNAEAKALEAAKNKELIELKNFRFADIISEEEYQKQLYEIEVKYLSLRAKLADKYGKDSSGFGNQIMDKMLGRSNQLHKSTQKPREVKPYDVPEEETQAEDSDYLVNKFKASADGQLAILEAQHEAGLISEEEYQDRISEIQAEKLAEREEVQRASMQVVSDLAGSFSDLYGAMMDGEIRKVENRYDKQIKAAKKAGKDTSKLEEEKEAAINDIKKKYADKQFAAAVLQVTATTAITAMEAYKAMAGIPIVGPALGAAAAAAAVVAGAAQIAVAKQQRDEAKGLKEGGYSEGYTDSGNPNEVAGVIPVHKNEFVANHMAVQNPHVKQFLDVFDLAQKNGSIRWLNTTQILEQIRTSAGKYSGGYTGSAAAASDSLGGVNQDMMIRVIQLLTSIDAHCGKISSDGLFVDVRTIRDGLHKLDKLESHVSR